MISGSIVGQLWERRNKHLLVFVSCWFTILAKDSRGARKAWVKYVADVKKASQPRAFDYRESIMLWNFSDPETVNKWDCISDKDINGYSNAHFGPNRKGDGVIFHGKLDTEIPANKSANRSGFCAIRSKPKQATLFESDLIDVSEYDAFEFCLRSDGRRFIINVTCTSFVNKDDIWQFFLFPRGGPDWEEITVHFGDFFVTHRGYMQDLPFPFNRRNLSTVGILLADRVVGEFQLELKYIKAVRRMLTKPEFID